VSLNLNFLKNQVQTIHDPNRAAAAKVGGYQPNRAPLYQRSMCSYTTQFVPRPLDGCLINAECYLAMALVLSEAIKKGGFILVKRGFFDKFKDPQYANSSKPKIIQSKAIPSYKLFKEKCETPATSSGGKAAKFRSETTTANCLEFSV